MMLSCPEQNKERVYRILYFRKENKDVVAPPIPEPNGDSCGTVDLHRTLAMAWVSGRGNCVIVVVACAAGVRFPLPAVDHARCSAVSHPIGPARSAAVEAAVYRPVGPRPPPHPRTGPSAT
jgi:hypothetical protein